MNTGISNGVKILYIITQADGGGAQKYTLALAKYFGGIIAAGNEAKNLFMDAKTLGVKCIELRHLKRSINPYHDFLAAWEIRELIKAEQPDIVHLNSSKAGILGSFAAIGLKKKVVFTAHGFVFNEPLSASTQAFYLALEKTASSYRDFIITVSDADKKSALDNKLISNDKIQTIHNGIAPIAFYDKNKALGVLGLPNDKIIIGCVANFYKTKGLDVLIEAVGVFADGIKAKILCAIIGDGGERKNLENQISTLGLSMTVKLLGNSQAIPEALKAFDIFTLASRKEGLPYTLLEAMQAGLPIIATNVGGNPEAIGDAGLLVPAENPQALAEAMTKLIGDDIKKKQLSQKALERAGLFTETKMLEETEKIYLNLLK